MPLWIAAFIDETDDSDEIEGFQECKEQPDEIGVLIKAFFKRPNMNAMIENEARTGLMVEDYIRHSGEIPVEKNFIGGLVSGIMPAKKG